MRGLTGKIAIVAGGGSGIGAATATRLAEEGAYVVVGDLNGDNAETVAAGIVDKGGKAIPVTFDISKEASVAALVAAAVGAYGGLDVIHVNAADLRAAMEDTDVLTLPLEIYDQTMAVNLRGHFLCARHAIPEILKRGGGALVFTSSHSAYAGELERVAYGMSKSGMHALLRHVASRWGKQNIRANAVAPGLVLSETARRNMSTELEEHARRLIRSSRFGEPEDIAAAVAFLCSKDGEWINGQIISVDGGVSMRG